MAKSFDIQSLLKVSNAFLLLGLRVFSWKGKEKKAFKIFPLIYIFLPMPRRGRRGRDRMVVGFKTTYAIIAYHH
jgi:hypothetical protein